MHGAPVERTSSYHSAQENFINIYIKNKINGSRLGADSQRSLKRAGSFNWLVRDRPITNSAEPVHAAKRKMKKGTSPSIRFVFFKTGSALRISYLFGVVFVPFEHTRVEDFQRFGASKRLAATKNG